MRYLITLKPLEPFFFGGEQTFGELGDKENSSYIATSRLFPQQSAILGMIKKELLKAKGYLTRKLKDEWVDEDYKLQATNLVGKDKFSFENKLHDYGKIKNISPIFLIKEDEKYFYIKDIFDYNLSLNPPLFYKGDKKYSYKNEIEAKLIKDDFSKKIEINKVFKQKMQVGNQKNKTDDAFFKKISYQLDKDFKFAFYIEIDEKIDDLDNKIVHLGADRSKFLLNLKQDNSTLELNLPDIGYKYVVLLSDSYIKDLKAKFAITSEISFAYKKKNSKKFQKSQKYYFYEKGSIIIEPDSSFYTQIDRKNLTQIGYNYYKEKKQWKQIYT